jgi:hypothetical protein
VILSDIPPLLSEFLNKRPRLLWRGTRDGFSANAFHQRCDHRSGSLTIILDSDGNVFGGFTPVKWDSTSGYKGDCSLASFLFTLANPHGLPARRFDLAVTGKAIFCDAALGPTFGGCPADLCVANQADTNANSFTSGFGSVYANDSGIDGETVFTGGSHFATREIEVFEVKTFM